MSGPDAAERGHGMIASAAPQTSYPAIVKVALSDPLWLIRKTGQFDSSHMQNGIRSVCTAARARRIPAERVIMEIKELWATLPPAAGLARAGGSAQLLSQVLTMALDEYYSSVPAETSTSLGR